MIIGALMPLLAAAAPVAARGHWAAFDRGDHCEAVGRALLPEAIDKPAAIASLSFDRAGPRRGEFALRFRRPLRAGSTVVLTIGGQAFQLVGRGTAAWSRDAAQERAIIAAMRAAGGMRSNARDGAGRRMVDRFALDGAPTAIDAAAACASSG